MRIALRCFVAWTFASVVAATEPGKPINLFDGKDLTGWQVKGKPEKSFWRVGAASLKAGDPKQIEVAPGGSELINAGSHGVDIYSEAKFGDATIELEVMVPQGSNSGIYVMGEYEIQVLDSFGKGDKLGMGDMGAIYGFAVPKKNACKEPGQWQQYVIEYVAPRFDAAGNKTANARILKIALNGLLIHENVELTKQTPGGVTGKECAQGPLMFQGNHGAVAYRNIRITPRATTH